MIKNSFKKEDFSKKIHEKTGLPFNLSKKIIDDLIIILSEHIKDNKLIIKNIGRFKIESYGLLKLFSSTLMD